MGSIGKRDNKENQFFFDSPDFTPDHDRITLALHRQYKSIIERLFQEMGPESMDIWELVLEPSLPGYPILFPDAIAGVTLYHPKREVDRAVVFEVKPRIGSFGSLIRQLRLYKDRIDSNGWLLDSDRFYNPLVCVITNDDRYDETLQEQGFPVIHLPAEE